MLNKIKKIVERIGSENLSKDLSNDRIFQNNCYFSKTNCL